MIKVIGEAPEQCICQSCSAKLEYAKTDVLTCSGRDYYGGSSGEEYINCPRCGEKVVLKSW